jgi:CAAX protease family protein
VSTGGTRRVRRRTVSDPLAIGLYVVTAFALSWAWAWPLAWSDALVRRGGGSPTHFPALIGPAVSAFLVTAWVGGRHGVTDLLARMGRWRFPLYWWAVTLSPLAFLGVALLIQAVIGTVPPLSDFGKYTGLPSMGVWAVVVIAVVLNGFGSLDGAASPFRPLPLTSARLAGHW